MQGVIFESAGAEPTVVDNLEKPKPSPDQILVKSLYTAINPVDSFMSSTGVLVTSWPFVLGCDAAGVVVEVGDNVGSKFKVGDEVCGCTRLGVPGHSTAQEFFLMDAALSMPKPKNISTKQAATLGVGTYTAALGLFNGLKIKLPDLENLPEEKSEDESEPGSKSPPLEKENEKDREVASQDDEPPNIEVDAVKVENTAPKPNDDASEESTPTATVPRRKTEGWVVVLGGASSVGKYAIQLARIAGYKVAASCSASSAEMIKDLGATPFDYKKPLDHQAKEVLSITSNKPYLIFDAAATGDALAKEIFQNLPADDESEKLFTTTGNAPPTIHGHTTHRIALGPLGRAEAGDLNADIEKFIPLIVGLVEKERLIPNPCDVVGSGGFGDVIEALRYQQKGAGGRNKVVVQIQDA